MDFELRRDKLLHTLREHDVESMLVTSFVNVTYLTGFTGDDSYLLVHADRCVLLSDTRYAEQLAEQCPGLALEIRSTPTTMTQSVADTVSALGLAQVAVEADSMTLSLRDTLAAALSAVSWRPLAGCVEQQRAIKDADEVAEIRRSIALAEEVFEVLRRNLRADDTERRLAADLEHEIRLRGGQGCAFPPIVAAGPRAALPHAVVTDQPIGEHPLLLVDWGARAGLYCSDLTRVLAIDRITPELELIYGVVIRAQARALACVRPGALMNEVDHAARGYIAQAGYGQHFGHGLGHGFGLQIHEHPRLTPAEPRCLEAGMVITIEPGVYVPGWGGVRIEDDVLVTPDGHEVLTHAAKDLEQCVVRLHAGAGGR